MSISCYRIRSYSFQSFKRKALLLLSITFLCSLINYSLECLVIIINKCINLLNESNPFLLNFISPYSKRVLRSYIKAFFCYGSIFILGSRVSQNLIDLVDRQDVIVLLSKSSFLDQEIADLSSSIFNVGGTGLSLMSRSLAYSS